MEHYLLIVIPNDECDRFWVLYPIDGYRIKRVTQA